MGKAVVCILGDRKTRIHVAVDTSRRAVCSILADNEQGAQSDCDCDWRRISMIRVWRTSSGSLMAKVPSTCAFYPPPKEWTKTPFESDR